MGITDTLFNLVKSDSIQQGRIKELLVISGAIVAYSQELTDLYRASGKDSAFARLQQGEGIVLNNQLNKKISEIEDYENRHLDLRRKQVAETQKNSIFFIIITSAVGFILTILSFIFLNRDKRKQRLLQNEVLAKERIVTQYLEAIPDGVMVVNQEQEIVLLNQSGREILGLKAGTLETLAQQTNQLKLLDPTRYHVRFTADLLPVARALQGEKLIANKIDLIKNDKIYHLETNVQPVIGLNGEITSAITVFRDITERANYEATLEKARTLAEKSVRVKDIFLSNVSHEIRTPLNAIIGFTNLLVSEVKEPKSVEYVGYIQYASKNLLELINDILDFSKIEAGQVHLENTDISIQEFVDSISAIINQRATEKGIAYRAHVQQGVPAFVESDKLRLTQILLNVCGNAVKFTEKGEVTLTVAPISDVVNGIQIIRFEVKDTGIGIPKDKIKDVFNRFVQATESTTRMFGGTGLGLSIVKSLVQLFDGTLRLESEMGEGSVFTIDLPLKVVEHTVPEEDLEEPIDLIASVKSLRVLAAEDNLLNQKLLQAIFERLNVSLKIVNNGQEAIDELQNDAYDLILMDIQMPVMDGYTAIREIRNSVSKTIPIITMTAHAMVGEKEECLSIGANSYISKPFKESELLYTIAHLGNNKELELPMPQPPIVQPPNSMNESILNLNYLTEITGGDIELRDELIALFETDSQIQLKTIEESSASGDLDKLCKAIHKFRSSLFSVGLLATAAQYKELETTLKQGKWTDPLNERLVQLKAESATGILALKQLQQDQPS